VVAVSTSISISGTAVSQLLEQPGGPVWQAADRAGIATTSRARIDLTAANLVNTGVLRNSIEHRTTAEPGRVVSRVGTDVGYARYVHEGTTGPIYPRTARVLRFQPRGSSSFVFADSVRGTRETGRYSPFLTNALQQLTTSDYL
jgi:hypothetical protein